MFHFAALNFWNGLESPCRCPHSDAQLSGDLAYAEPLGAKLRHSAAIEDLLGPMRGQILSRTTIDGHAHAPRLEILEVSRTAGFGSLPNQLPFKLRRGSQHVEQKFGRWISIVRPTSLGSASWCEGHSRELEARPDRWQPMHRRQPPIHWDNRSVDKPRLLGRQE